MDLKDFLKSINIDFYGISKKVDFYDIESKLIKYNSINPLDFCNEPLENRLNSRAILGEVRTIISILLPYELDNKISRNKDISLVAYVSNNAWEIDYHNQLKEKLEKIADYFKEIYEDLDYKCIVDTSPLIDRKLAYEAGIGCYGKNTFLINKELGSRFYIGSILLNKDIDLEDIEETSSKQKKSCDLCDECDLCVKYCPGNALIGDYTINFNNCISYLTQKKEDLSYGERKLITNRIYGCDICQRICPYNKKELELEDEYRRKTSNALDPIELIKTSNKKLRKDYKDSGFIWRGPNILKRNAIIAIGNSGKSEGCKFLIDYYYDLSLDHRLYALWSIYSLDRDIFYKFINNNEKLSEDERLEITRLEMS